MTKEQLEREQQLAAEIRAKIEESWRTGQPLDLTPTRKENATKEEEPAFDAYWISPEAEDPETGFMTECEFPNKATQWTLYGVVKGDLPEKIDAYPTRQEAQAELQRRGGSGEEKMEDIPILAKRDAERQQGGNERDNLWDRIYGQQPAAEPDHGEDMGR